MARQAIFFFIRTIDYQIATKDAKNRKVIAEVQKVRQKDVARPSRPGNRNPEN
jgi:hypothetical protein